MLAERTNTPTHVFKDGERLEFDFSAIEAVVDWALRGVDLDREKLLDRIRGYLYDGISTEEINDTLAKIADAMTCGVEPDWSLVAGRMQMRIIWNRVHGDVRAKPDLHAGLRRGVEGGWYDPAMLEGPDGWSPLDIERLDSFMIHDRDFEYHFGAVSQFQGKYLVRNRTTGELLETPQTLYMLAAMGIAAAGGRKDRVSRAAEFYETFSTGRVNLPTPILSGVRTPTRQFSSCVLIEMADSLASVGAVASVVQQYASRRAGLGVNVGALRGMGASVRNGEVSHTGVVPFVKFLEAAVKSCSQGGVRNGAATLFFPLWHYEADRMLVLKNNKGVDENRARHMDYGVQLSGLFYERLVYGGSVTRFGNEQTPGLYEAFFRSQPEFRRLYEGYEADPSVDRKVSEPAADVFSLVARERLNTGRLYIQHVDLANEHGPFIPEYAPIRQSNLCMEILLPTSPLTKVEDERAEISLCTLAAYNLRFAPLLARIPKRDWGKALLSWAAPLARIAVRYLDDLLDHQDYMVPASRKATMDYRPLGVGVVDFAGWLARNGKRHSDGSANEITHALFEAMSWCLVDASRERAREAGAFPLYENTRWSRGEMPVDRYKPEIDAEHPPEHHMDWDGLRKKVRRDGLRNATLTAVMPSEASSQVSNATNGIEPPRSLVSTKGSREGYYNVAVPDCGRLEYETAWEMDGNRGYLLLAGIMQKFLCHGASLNCYYPLERWENRKVPLQEVLSDMLYAHQVGCKNLYYVNTTDGSGKDVVASGCESGACAI